uniref:Uncharacterized protein n=1 Tax=Anguilla anguilla TaxID=7936 RepID=A0A0E9XQA9_ANGAN
MEGKQDGTAMVPRVQSQFFTRWSN